MLKLPEQQQKNTTTLLVKAIHPNYSYNEVSLIIIELNQLKPIVEEKKKEEKSKDKNNVE